MKRVTKKVASKPHFSVFILSCLSFGLILLPACSGEGGGKEKIVARSGQTTGPANSSADSELSKVSNQVCDDKEIFNLNLILEKIKTEAAVSNKAARLTVFNLRTLSADSSILDGTLTDASEDLNARVLLWSEPPYVYGMAKEIVSTSEKLNVTAHEECESYTFKLADESTLKFTIDKERSNPSQLVLTNADGDIRVFSNGDNGSLDLVEYLSLDVEACGQMLPVQRMVHYKLSLDNQDQGVPLHVNLLGLISRHMLLNTNTKQVSQHFLTADGQPLNNRNDIPTVSDVDYLDLMLRLSEAKPVEDAVEAPYDFKLEACQ